MDSDMIMLELGEKMEKALQNLEKRFATVRAGRANPSSLDGVMVEYYGSMTPLKQLATISVPEARQLLIKPFDRGSLKNIEKAILTSNLGYNPGNDGETIRIIIPELTEERRKELVKQVKALAEEAKVAIRNIRREGIEDVSKQVSYFARDTYNQVKKLTPEVISNFKRSMASNTTSSNNHFDDLGDFDFTFDDELGAMFSTDAKPSVVEDTNNTKK